MAIEKTILQARVLETSALGTILQGGQDAPEQYVPGEGLPPDVPYHGPSQTLQVFMARTLLRCRCLVMGASQGGRERIVLRS
jgi:hypothetical protein